MAHPVSSTGILIRDLHLAGSWILPYARQNQAREKSNCGWYGVVMCRRDLGFDWGFLIGNLRVGASGAEAEHFS